MPERRNLIVLRCRLWPIEFGIGALFFVEVGGRSSSLRPLHGFLFFWFRVPGRIVTLLSNAWQLFLLLGLGFKLFKVRDRVLNQLLDKVVWMLVRRRWLAERERGRLDHSLLDASPSYFVLIRFVTHLPQVDLGFHLSFLSIRRLNDLADSWNHG